MEGDATQSWCRMRDCADRNQKVENVGSYKKMRAWRTPGIGWSEESRHFTNARVLRRWAHLLHRATSDICGAVLDYDQAHVFNLSAIICYIILTFAFGMTGKLHQAKMHCQFPLNFCRIWWSYFNSLNRHWWKVEFAINLLPSIDIFLDFWGTVLLCEHSKESSAACQDVMCYIEPSNMQVTESFNLSSNSTC